jgi:hypothetical protein
MASLTVQLAWLLFLAIPIACVAWTFTHEELLKELQVYCARKSEKSKHWYQRKFFYLFTCEYCFSHYVTAGFLALTGFHLLLDDWRGLVIAGFALVWVANIYMSIFGRLRLEIRSERVEIEMKEKVLEEETT